VKGVVTLFMKFWLLGRSPRSGLRYTWLRIKKSMVPDIWANF